MFEIDTIAVHGGKDPSEKKERNICSINLCTTGEEITGDNNTKKDLEECVASLEFAKYALVFPSGLAAISSIAQLLQDGDHAIVFDSVYHGTRNYLSLCEKMGKIKVSFVDLRDHSILKKQLRRNTKMVWIETPCNPTMKLVDIAAIAESLKEFKDIFLLVDNTFMSPYFQNPLRLGADIALHSLTKYMNGHSDVVMGAIATSNDDLYKKLKTIQNTTGSVPGPLDCFLVRRGLKTLHLRMKRHMENATQIAQYLDNHPKVEKVFYPGLKSHPQHELGLRQCRGFSGMVSFQVKGGKTEAFVFGQNLKTFTLAVSLGGTESLADISSFMTASALNAKQREELGVTDNLIRLSVGLESSQDLIADLEQALGKVGQDD